MHAVLIEVDVSQLDREAGLKNLREEVVPSVSRAPGFMAGYWLRSTPEDAIGTSLLLFDTEADAEAASREITVGSTIGLGATVKRREVREVVASA
jgi:hypothetical protein